MNKTIGLRILSSEIVKPADKVLKPDSEVFKKPMLRTGASSSQTLRISGSLAKPLPKIDSVAHLVKNKFLPVASTKPPGTQRIVSTEGSSQNSNKQSVEITKNFIINGKSLPLKVVKIIPGYENGPPKTPLQNRLIANVPSLSSKNAPYSVTHYKIPTNDSNNEDDPNNDVLTELENLKKKVKQLANPNNPFPFPLKNVEEALKFNKDSKENRFSMKLLLKFLKNSLPGQYESVIEELLPVIFTDEAIEGFNFTGKGKESFKKLKINDVLMSLSKLPFLEYKREVTRCIQNIHTRIHRRNLKAKVHDIAGCIL